MRDVQAIRRKKTIPETDRRDTYEGALIPAVYTLTDPFP
jgi:hypothetical protein